MSLTETVVYRVDKLWWHWPEKCKKCKLMAKRELVSDALCVVATRRDTSEIFREFSVA